MGERMKAGIIWPWILIGGDTFKLENKPSDILKKKEGGSLTN
jgi:hypothetical protein